VPKRRGIGGLSLHADGGVVVTGRDVSHVRDGQTRTLLAFDDIAGFNDMGTDADGRIYVGTMRFQPFKGESPVPGEVWRIDGEGKAVELFGGIDWPNGIGISPDGRTIYACDYSAARVMAGEQVFAEVPAGGADGLAVDADGAVWVALAQGGGIARFMPDGSLGHILDVPSSFVTSLCFGGEDLRDLYITTMDNSEVESRRGTLFRTRVDVPGLAVPPARV
jgi:gluconolactonase